MHLLSTVERDTFRVRLSRMRSPVHLLVFTRQDGRRDAAARQLGRELRALSPDVHLELHDVDANPQLAARYGIGRTPGFALLTGGVIIEDTHIRFSGLPEGAARTALVDGMVALSAGDPTPTDTAERRARRLDRPVHLDVFVPGPAAVDPQALVRLQRLALLSTQLSLDVVIEDGSPAWARRPDSAEPLVIVVNHTIVLRAGWSEQRLLDAVEAATSGEPERLTPPPPGPALLAGWRVGRAARERGEVHA
jgi:hypothetical protein